MSRTLKIILTVLSVIAVGVCLFCILYIVQYFRGNSFHSATGESVRITDTIVLQPAPEASAPAETGVPPAEETEPGGETEPGDEEETATNVVSAIIDFEALWGINEEIYAWVEVPGTNISYAVAQSATNDLYYNSHNLDRSYFSGGSIYSQRYNSKDFTDSVTVLYGHDLQSRTMFSQVNDFSDPECFEANRYIYVYTPEKVFVYEIFAAYPHNKEHLLLCHDFTDETQFNAYFDSLVAGTDANYRSDLFPQFGERVLTLSTCYRPNHSMRYLVQGVLVAEYDVAQ